MEMSGQIREQKSGVYPVVCRVEKLLKQVQTQTQKKVEQ